MADPYWDNVVLAMPMDGENNSTTFTDLTGKTVTPAGDAKISTEQSKFGGASAYFDGTGDLLSVATSADFNLGSGSFTLECFAYFTSVADTPHVITITDNTGYNEVRLQLAAGKVAVRIYHSGSYQVNISGSTTIVANTWYHLAAVRDGDNHILFLDGDVEASVSKSHTVPSGSYIAVIGQVSVPGFPGYGMTGYVDDPRITAPVARYTSSFTPPDVSYFDLDVAAGQVAPPLEQISGVGTTAIVGRGTISPPLDSVSVTGYPLITKGAIVPPLEIVSGFGSSLLTSGGRIHPPKEEISGSGYSFIAGYGNFKPKKERVAGYGWSGLQVASGQVIPPKETVFGTGTTSIIGRGVVRDRIASVSGSGEIQQIVVGYGAVRDYLPIVSGSGTRATMGNGRVADYTPVVSGSGGPLFIGSGVIRPIKESVSGRGLTSPTIGVLSFQRDPFPTGTPATSPEYTPLSFSRN